MCVRVGVRGRLAGMLTGWRLAGCDDRGQLTMQEYVCCTSAAAVISDGLLAAPHGLRRVVRDSGVVLPQDWFLVSVQVLADRGMAWLLSLQPVRTVLKHAARFLTCKLACRTPQL